jgi:hypothetical protein
MIRDNIDITVVLYKIIKGPQISCAYPFNSHFA